MTLEIRNEEIDKLSVTSKKSAALGSESVSLLPLTGAVGYFAEQARERHIFDEQEKTNEEFRGAVRTRTSYSKWYTLPVYYLECLEELRDDSCKKNSMLEKDCIHGYNCRRINNCPCTSDLEVKRYNDIRKQKRQRDHNIKRKPKMTKRQKKQQEHHNEEQKELEEWKKEHWDPTLEDLK